MSARRMRFQITLHWRLGFSSNGTVSSERDFAGFNVFRPLALEVFFRYGVAPPLFARLHTFPCIQWEPWTSSVVRAGGPFFARRHRFLEQPKFLFQVQPVQRLWLVLDIHGPSKINTSQ